MTSIAVTVQYDRQKQANSHQDEQRRKFKFPKELKEGYESEGIHGRSNCKNEVVELRVCGINIALAHRPVVHLL